MDYSLHSEQRAMYTVYCLVFLLRLKTKHEGKVNSELLLKSLETGFLDEAGEVLHSVSGSDEVNR